MKIKIHPNYFNPLASNSWTKKDDGGHYCTVERVWSRHHFGNYFRFNYNIKESVNKSLYNFVIINKYYSHKLVKQLKKHSRREIDKFFELIYSLKKVARINEEAFFEKHPHLECLCNISLLGTILKSILIFFNFIPPNCKIDQITDLKEKVREAKKNKIISIAQQNKKLIKESIKKISTCSTFFGSIVMQFDFKGHFKSLQDYTQSHEELKKQWQIQGAEFPLLARSLRHQLIITEFGKESICDIEIPNNFPSGVREQFIRKIIKFTFFNNNLKVNLIRTAQPSDC